MSLTDKYREFAHLSASSGFQWLACHQKADGLSVAVRAQFQSQAEPLKADAMNRLQAVGFTEVHGAFSKRITAYLALRDAHTKASTELPDVERQLKSLDLQVKHASDKKGRNRLLKSKATQWEEASQHGNLEKERESLLRARAAARATLEQAKQAHDALDFDFARDPDADTFKWLGGRASRLTIHGDFLLGVLKQMPVNHFHGRQLGDVLNIGFLLA